MEYPSAISKKGGKNQWPAQFVKHAEKAIIVVCAIVAECLTSTNYA